VGHEPTTSSERFSVSRVQFHSSAHRLHGHPAHTRRAYRADVDRFLTFVATPLAIVALGDVQAFSPTR
jgi:hypothetical protein